MWEWPGHLQEAQLEVRPRAPLARAARVGHVAVEQHERAVVGLHGPAGTPTGSGAGVLHARGRPSRAPPALGM